MKFTKTFSLLLVMLLVGINQQLFSQDLIVTKTNDSTNVFIKKITNQYIYYFSKNHNTSKKQKIKTTAVNSYKLNFYTEEAALNGYFVKNYPPYKLNFSTGYSHRLIKNIPLLSSENTAVFEHFKSGYHFNIDAIYYIDCNSGIGLKYINSIYQHHLYTTSLENNPVTLSDNVQIRYLGPFLSFQNRKNLFCNLGLGFLSLSNNSFAINNPTIIKGKTIGGLLEIGKDFNLTKKLLLGAQSSFIFGHLYTIDVSDGTTNKHISLDDKLNESLNTVLFSIGLKYIP